MAQNLENRLEFLVFIFYTSLINCHRFGGFRKLFPPTVLQNRSLMQDLSRLNSRWWKPVLLYEECFLVFFQLPDVSHFFFPPGCLPSSKSAMGYHIFLILHGFHHCISLFLLPFLSLYSILKTKQTCNNTKTSPLYNASFRISPSLISRSAGQNSFHLKF